MLLIALFVGGVLVQCAVGTYMYMCIACRCFNRAYMGVVCVCVFVAGWVGGWLAPGARPIGRQLVLLAGPAALCQCGDLAHSHAGIPY